MQILVERLDGLSLQSNLVSTMDLNLVKSSSNSIMESEKMWIPRSSVFAAVLLIADIMEFLYYFIRIIKYL